MILPKQRDPRFITIRRGGTLTDSDHQLLALWAAATSAFLALMVAGGPVARHRYSTYALLVPSVWLVLLWLLPVTNSGPAHILLFWIGVAITLLGVPALAAFMKLAQLEGIIPALESSHAVAACMERAPRLGKNALIIVNLSGRGDKDVAQVADKVGLQMPV